MKIMLVVEQFDSSMGYLEYYLARELVKLNHKVYILTFNKKKECSRGISREGFEVIRIPYILSIYSYHLPTLRGVKHLLNLLRVEKIDVIHCQPLGSILSLFFIATKNLFNFKIVGSIVTQLNLVFSPWDLKEKILFAFSKIIISHYVAKNAEMVFAKTSGLAKIISQSYNIPQNKFRIIPLGADPELFKFNSEARAIIRKELGISENDVIIVYSGKINPSKRLHVLIEALSPIIKRDRRVKLLIIGRGDADYIKLLKKLIFDGNIAENIIFHPWVERTMLNSLYSASDIGVWPGLSSISIVEAASSGLPLVIARYPVEIYAVENGNGFTFKIDDVNGLRRCLEILIYDEKLRKEMGCKSRKLVKEKLNWKTITLKYLDAYMDAEKAS
jgi:glycosyltransferase involved in cell wall biosynthesis